MRVRAALVVLFSTFAAAPVAPLAQTATESQKGGAELYRAACASCHGPDGRGSPRTTVGFDIPLPDFTDCSFATPEADADWSTIIQHGGQARAFDRMMPAFGEALAPAEILRIVDYVRGFCEESGWPRGDLNLPRPLATEKAFPENEAVVTTTVARGEAKSIDNEFVYERRLGRRGQWEVAVPFAHQQVEGGQWRRGLGDIAVAYKHVVFDSLARGSILSAGSEVVFPTGKESDGLGGGATVFEPFGTISQMLPRDGFLHLHGGFEVPLGVDEKPTEAFWRAALGKTWFGGRWGRAWSPMIELLGARELAAGEPAQWDLLPQMQVSLSTRQHVLLNAGVRLPVNERQARKASFLFYVLWDWFDGGLLSGW